MAKVNVRLYAKCDCVVRIVPVWTETNMRRVKSLLQLMQFNRCYDYDELARSAAVAADDVVATAAAAALAAVVEVTRDQRTVAADECRHCSLQVAADTVVELVEAGSCQVMLEQFDTNKVATS